MRVEKIKIDPSLADYFGFPHTMGIAHIPRVENLIVSAKVKSVVGRFFADVCAGKYKYSSPFLIKDTDMVTAFKGGGLSTVLCDPCTGLPEFDTAVLCLTEHFMAPYDKAHPVSRTSKRVSDITAMLTIEA